ncbi:winged helix-turn-helix transcriptional regulator [Mucilaginibacter kameinonensis]|uniref:winged helix-turn-helix transcriptional regulator n=1 Tax=Mucilaginibacter kameinonensis TaxID=452286 RepID=UPI000EF7A0FE|nr:helix-turn-helix domain-containing protein [Mucilaginibacter kameinonensis]
MKKTKVSSTNQVNKNYLEDICMGAYALGIIGSRWKLSIFFNLKDRPMRFSELKYSLNGITERMLALNLAEMEKDKILTRIVFAEVPARVVYELTPIGKALTAVWDQLDNWGRQHKDLISADALL